MTENIDVNISEQPVPEVVEVRVDENAAQSAIDAAALAQNALTQVQNIVANIADINTILNDEGFVKDATTFTGNENSVWNINGVQYTNPADVIINIPLAATGMQRWDRIVLNTSNLFERVPGPELETNPPVPSLPDDTLDYTLFLVTDSTVGDPSPPIVGDVYKKKIENTRWKSTQSGSEVVIPFQAAGQSHYSVVHSGLISVAGFSIALLTTPMYEGQDVLFENQTGNAITLKDMFGSTPVKFNLGADLVVKNGGKIWFKFRNNELELIMNSYQQNDIFSINWSSTFNPAASVNWYRMVRSVGGWLSNSFEVENIATFNPNLSLFNFDGRVPKHIVGSNSKAIEATVSVNLNSNGETIRILCLAFKINPANGIVYNQTPIFDTTIVNAVGLNTTVVHPSVDTNHIFSKGDFVTYFIFNNNLPVTGRTIFANLQLGKI